MSEDMDMMNLSGLAGDQWNTSPLVKDEAVAAPSEDWGLFTEGSDDEPSFLSSFFKDDREDADPFDDAEWMENVDLSNFLPILRDEYVDLPVVVPPPETVKTTSAAVGAFVCSHVPLQSPEEQVAPDHFEAASETAARLNYIKQTPTSVYTTSCLTGDLFVATDLNIKMEPEDGDELMASPLSYEDVDSILSEQLSPLSASSESVFDACSSDSSVSKVTPSRKSKSKRSSPYPVSNSRSVVSEGMPVNKKEKKKLQNKQAAIRYRMKKREENDKVKSEQDALELQNKTLQEKAEEISKEIEYMKNLLAEILKAKRKVLAVNVICD